jgi:hypothetical protein
MRVKTSVKAGAWPRTTNHNEAQVRAGGLKVQSSIKAGKRILFTGRWLGKPSRTVQTSIKAGGIIVQG